MKSEIDASEQLTFSFKNGDSSKKQSLKPLDARRALLAWMIKQNPTGVGVKVPTRFSRYQADVAAFWSAPMGGVLRPERTVIVEVRLDRGQCWPDCSNRNDLLSDLRTEKERKKELEATIRETEPQLRDMDTLFAEFETWNYADSENPEYQRCLRAIERVEHSLYHGSRFERIRSARVADNLYLAVPAGAVHADELADGWGLLFIEPDLSVHEIKAPERWECPLDNKLHLAQNVAMSIRNSLLFANGIRVSSDGEVTFTPVPRRRRRPQKR